MVSSFSSLNDLLCYRTDSQPDSVVYGFWEGGKEVTWTYSQLHERVSAVAKALQPVCQPGDRAVLLLRPGLSYVASFLGCLYAGVTAVPSYPPGVGGPTQSARRLDAIIADARPAIVLVDAASTPPNLASGHTHLDAASLPVVTVDELPVVRHVIAPHPVPGSEIAFLQYTSGSTATPKGVMVTHGNLFHNAHQIQELFGLSEQSRAAIWLPPYHDMGLIGGVFQALYSGYPVHLMSPLEFVRHPLRWLQAISRHRATVSGGPSFAYDLCARKATPEQVAELDLSSWRVAFNGAEPVQAEVLERFTRTFEPAGFDPSSFAPCYGLAEATLVVTASPPGKPARVIHRDRSRVSCGQAHPSQRVVIVDPEAGIPCREGGLGEIWVSGPSVAAGYWDRPAETEASFHARLVGDDRTYLRTGDLGFMDAGELFIAGRIKDLIIVRGANHHPEDIEQTISGAHPAISRAAAYGSPGDNFDVLVAAVEVPKPVAANALDELVEAIRSAVADGHQIAVDRVILLRAGAIPRTSSGKVRRSALRELVLRGHIGILAEHTIGPSQAAVPVSTRDKRQELVDLVRAEVAARLGVAPHTLDLNRTGPQMGLDSLALIQVQHAIEERLGVELPLANRAHGVPFGQVVDELLELHRSDAAPLELVGAALSGPPCDASDYATAELTHGQRGLWILEQMSEDQSLYNLSSAVRLPEDADLEVVERALQYLVDRHEALRTMFVSDDGAPAQRILPAYRVQVELSTSDDTFASGLDSVLAAAAARPFDLATGPPMRAYLWRPSGQAPVMMLVIHHLISDFWSLALLWREFAATYAAMLAGQTPQMPAAGRYRDHAGRQARYLQSENARRDEVYWHQRLAGHLSMLELPTDRPRPKRQTFRGAGHTFVIDPSVTSQLEALAARCGCGLFTVLLSAYQVMLHRYSRQDDIMVGTPVAGRASAHDAHTVGYFVNPVIMRVDLSGNPSFEAMLSTQQRLVSESIEHQGIPFALLAERLQPERDPGRSPMFQTMFMYQQAPPGASRELSLLAVGRDGVRLEVDGAVFTSVAVPPVRSPFDLTLAIAPVGGELACAWQYNADLFDSATIQRMAEDLAALLAGIASDPSCRIGWLPLISEEKRGGLVRRFSREPAPYPVDDLVHEAISTQARLRPEALAVVTEIGELTYAELDLRASRLAGYLNSLAVGAETFVGVCAERSPNALTAILAVLKSGAAYVPLDPQLPAARLEQMVRDSGMAVVLTHTPYSDRFAAMGVPILDLADEAVWTEREPATMPPPISSANAAYMLYTSGSTGVPKGVVVSHGNVVNFFAGMDERVGCGPADTILATTSVTFDISVLELLWPMARGARVVIASEQAMTGRHRAHGTQSQRPLDFSLFYFASAATASLSDKYRLVLDGTRFADRCGFKAVWTPERHFHDFGGLYPNPSTLSAALATITSRVQLRAGSVVLPLHSPLRVAEEWSLVDNLSGGRAGVAFASGWHADDFAFFPENYAERKKVMMEAIGAVKRLWAGESLKVSGGAGNEIDVKIFPTPVQPELPIWITAAGHPDTFTNAGALGANVLTHLLGQTIDQVAENIRRYRTARAANGHDPHAGVVTLMLHTFIADDLEQVRRTVQVPFREYLRSSVGLIENLVRSLNLPLDLASLSADDMNALLDFAFDRYFDTAALFGTPESVRSMVERVRAIEVDEIACLIDFGVPQEDVLAALPALDEVRRLSILDRHERLSLAGLASAHRPTLMQATPSLMYMVLADPAATQALTSLRALLVGGEELTSALAREIRGNLPAKLINMYGPTETTIWSSTHTVEETDEPVPLGEPIVNTQLYVVDSFLQPVPVGVVGELVIGGDGLARGYWTRPELTAERFVPDSLGVRPGGRLYCTGDSARIAPDGRLQFVGRMDNQIKLRGYRIELGEIEEALVAHPAIVQAVVAVQRTTAAAHHLVAYAVPATAKTVSPAEIREWTGARLPAYMVPSHITVLDHLPLTASGKVDRSRLPRPDTGAARERATLPKTELERRIAEIWSEVLGVGSVGIHDNFFDLGGHSLLVVQVHARLQALLGESFPLVTLLEHPTVHALGAHLSDSRGGDSLAAAQMRAQAQSAKRREYLATTKVAHA